MTRMWGLKSCDTCRRARRWLETRGIAFTFHDVREDPPERDQLTHWLKIVGADVLINRRGTTWRSLSESAKRNIESGDIVPTLEQYPALLKRPILEHGKQIRVGFDPAVYKPLFGASR
jgi:Spx/MgsR family transcriptional regulator